MSLKTPVNRIVGVGYAIILSTPLNAIALPEGVRQVTDLSVFFTGRPGDRGS
jgi:hypothetical protein